jgi:hypothetical protein
VLALYAFYRKNGLITSSQSFFLNLIDGGLRSYGRSVQLEKTKNEENPTRKNKECYRTHCFSRQPAQIPPTTQS